MFYIILHGETWIRILREVNGYVIRQTENDDMVEYTSMHTLPS